MGVKILSWILKYKTMNHKSVKAQVKKHMQNIIQILITK